MAKTYQKVVLSEGSGSLLMIEVDPLAPKTAELAKTCLNALFDKVIALNGCLSGEHGIGIEKRDYLAKQLPPETLDFMRQLKAVCDPQGILNPGKLLPMS